MHKILETALIYSCFEIVIKSIKVCVTTPNIRWVYNFQVTVLNFREILESVIVRTRQCIFDNYIYLFDFLKFMDYKIPKLLFEMVT